MYETRLKVIIMFILKYNDVLLYWYSKLLQTMHTFMIFDSIRGVGVDSFPFIQILG